MERESGDNQHARRQDLQDVTHVVQAEARRESGRDQRSDVDCQQGAHDAQQHKDDRTEPDSAASCSSLQEQRDIWELKGSLAVQEPGGSNGSLARTRPDPFGRARMQLC